MNDEIPLRRKAQVALAQRREIEASVREMAERKRCGKAEDLLLGKLGVEAHVESLPVVIDGVVLEVGQHPDTRDWSLLVEVHCQMCGAPTLRAFEDLAGLGAWLENPPDTCPACD